MHDVFIESLIAFVVEIVEIARRYPRHSWFSACKKWFVSEKFHEMTVQREVVLTETDIYVEGSSD